MNAVLIVVVSILMLAAIIYLVRENNKPKGPRPA